MTVQAAQDAGETPLVEALEQLRDRDRWVEYSLQHLSWVQEIGEALDLPIHLWPDKQLLNHVSDPWRDWLQAWRDRQSPEAFANRPLPTTSPPPVPDEHVSQPS